MKECFSFIELWLIAGNGKKLIYIAVWICCPIKLHPSSVQTTVHLTNTMQVPAVLDMRAISTRPLAWSSVHCGRWRDGRDIEMRGGGVRIKWKGNKRLLVAEPKRRLDFLLNMVLKPAASNKYSPSLWTACVPLAPVVYSDKEYKT